MLTDDLAGEEYKIIASIISINGVNYTTFKETTLFYMILVLPAMYMNRKFLAESQFDPYTREPASQLNVQAAFTWDLTIVLFCIFSHYVQQRDLLVISIENIMIQRNQLQLSEYFWEARDAIVVAK